MRVFWSDIVEPLVAILDPKVIVEIGSDEGKMTRLLLARGEPMERTLHSIDPSTHLDVTDLERRYPEQLVNHVSESLETIETIENDFDLVLINSDHNWYTVLGELRQIARQAKKRGRGFPMVLLHNVAWPYARRDLYCAPERIPEEHRQPYQIRGIIRGQSELAEAGGVNPQLAHADHEGGPANGVLTAVEDFLAETADPPHLIKLPVWHGLGILYSDAHTESNPALARYLAALTPTSTGHGLLAEAEARTNDRLLALQEQKHLDRHDQNTPKLRSLKGRVDALQAHNDGLQLGVNDLLKKLASVSGRLGTAQRSLAQTLNKTLLEQEERLGQ